MWKRSACLAEVSVVGRLYRISKIPREIEGELSMHKQCVPGLFFSTHALEPGNHSIRIMMVLVHILFHLPSLHCTENCQ